MCDPSNRECMMHRCTNCPGANALRKLLEEQLSDIDPDFQFHYSQWQTTDRASLVMVTSTCEEYKDTLISAINAITKHSFLAKRQANFLRVKKESLKANEVIVLGDFVENYQFLVQDEIQSYHWSKEYCTLHLLVVYFIDGDGNIQHNCLCFISDDNNHDTNFVYKIQTILVDYLKEDLPIVEKIFYFSDDCAEQHKNCKNFINLCHHQQNFNMDAVWIFFATQVTIRWCWGGFVKRYVAKRSLQRPLHDQILSYQSMLELCVREIPSITFFGVSQGEMVNVSADLEDCFAKSKTVPGTRSSHHFVPITCNKIARKLTSEDSEFLQFDFDKSLTEEIDIKNIKCFSYVSCIYDTFCWVGIVTEVNANEGDLKIEFLHPHGPRKTFSWPSVADKCIVPASNVLCVITAPTTTTGRMYRISDTDFEQTLNA